MISLLPQSGFRIVIFRNDDGPPSVHIDSGGLLKIQLVGESGLPQLIWAIDTSASTTRAALDVVTEHQQTLLEAWRQVHGAAD